MNTRAGLIRVLEAHRAEYRLLATPSEGWALVAPGLGARVLGAGRGQRNAFWVSPRLGSCLQGRDWNAGGQRTWIAPELGPAGFFGAAEADWAVPPALDPGAYHLQEAGAAGACCRGDCRLRGADGTEYRLQIERRVELCDLLPAGILLRLRHALRNLGDLPIPARVGLWAILQLPARPEVSLRLPDTPYRTIFGEIPAGSARRGTGGPQLAAAPGRRWKIGLHPLGPEALLTYCRPPSGAEPGLQVRLRCPVAPDGRYLDGGDVLQAYDSPLEGDDAFCELECHAPAAVLEPGQAAGQELEIEVAYDA